MRIVFRGDSGFCRQRILNYCERTDVHYIVGLARNARLQQITEFLELDMKDAFEDSHTKQRELGEFQYAANTWGHERRVITRLEYGEQGNNPRYVVTNLAGTPEDLYDGLYCQRGAARRRTGSRRRRWVCLLRARVASSSRAISCGCCWQHWAKRLF